MMPSKSHPKMAIVIIFQAPVEGNSKTFAIQLQHTRVFLVSCPSSNPRVPWLVFTGPVPSGAGMCLRQPSRQGQGRGRK